MGVQPRDIWGVNDRPVYAGTFKVDWSRIEIPGADPPSSKVLDQDVACMTNIWVLIHCGTFNVRSQTSSLEFGHMHEIVQLIRMTS